MRGARVATQSTTALGRGEATGAHANTQTQRDSVYALEILGPPPLHMASTWAPKRAPIIG